jgi:hypothetical protein
MLSICHLLDFNETTRVASEFGGLTVKTLRTVQCGVRVCVCANVSKISLISQVKLNVKNSKV